MGGSSEHLLKMIENCPDGADTLVARICRYLRFLQLYLSGWLQALLTSLSKEDFIDFVKEAGQDGERILSALKDYIPTLSAHQQKKIDRGVRDVIITCGDGGRAEAMRALGDLGESELQRAS
uniref:Uncharacterized protein n=1 Tax=Parascaris equorum TaxID=6256 RepID=A0A914RYZ6_PAREQ